MNSKVPLEQRLGQAEATLADLKTFHANSGDLKKYCREARAAVKEAGGLPMGYRMRARTQGARDDYVTHKQQTKGVMYTQHFNGPDYHEAAWQHYHDTQAASQTT